MTAAPNVVQLPPRQTTKSRRSKGKRPSDPMLAAVALRRRLSKKYCAALGAVDEAQNVEAPAILKQQLTALKAECERLENAAEKALEALSRIKPTTPAGAAALITYIREDVGQVPGADWHLDALANVARALAAMK
jgi:hypothetical protein